MERAGEGERGLVVGGDRGAWVGAAGEAAGVEADGRGDRELVLGDELAVDVQLRPARGALALPEVRGAGGPEFDPQLVPACGKHVRCAALIGRAADVVVRVAQPAVLDVQRPAAGAAALA